MSQPQHPYRHGCPICHITKTRLPFCIHRKHQRIIAMMALFQYERDLIEHLAGELGDLAQDFAEPQRHRRRENRNPQSGRYFHRRANLIFRFEAWGNPRPCPQEAT